MKIKLLCPSGVDLSKKIKELEKSYGKSWVANGEEWTETNLKNSISSLLSRCIISYEMTNMEIVREVKGGIENENNNTIGN